MTRERVLGSLGKDLADLFWRDSRLHLNASGGPSQLTLTSPQLQHSCCKGSGPHQPPTAMGHCFSSKPQFPFPSGFTSRPPCKDRPVSATWSPASPTHTHMPLMSGCPWNHDRKHWRHRGRREGPLPRAARRSRILWLFLLPCEGRSTDLLGEGHGTSRPGRQSLHRLPSLSGAPPLPPTQNPPAGPLHEHPQLLPPPSVRCSGGRGRSGPALRPTSV